jgi:MoxR-like ATPase
MTADLYSGTGGDAPAAAKSLPSRNYADATHPRSYLADRGLVDAVNTALLLRQPLLVTGEPGTGKTQLAASISWELGLGDKPLRFDAKSHSKSRDLLYSVDTLSWFQVAHSGVQEATALDFITYNALGLAILFACEPAQVAHVLPKNVKHPGKKRRSVVLVDEIDKAPRDFPNDLLSEIEEMKFRVPELNNHEIAAHHDFTPVVVFTSNSERDLPDAFLRRCVYYDIPFPEGDKLAEIARARLGEIVRDEAFLSDALSLFSELRLPHAGLRKRPATAELLGWITAIRRMAQDIPNPLRAKPDLAGRAIAALVKTEDDRDRAAPIVEAWIRKRSS